MKMTIKITSLLLIGALTFQSAAQFDLAQAATTETTASTATTSATTTTTVVETIAPVLKVRSEEPVTSGVTLRKFNWTAGRNNVPYSTDINVIEVDLQNPYVNMDVMTGKGGEFHTKQTVLGMVKETNAIAGINGDFFHMTMDRPPIGPQISSGKWMTTPLFSDGWYTFGITKDNKPIIDHYTFQGSVTAANGQSFSLAGINRDAQWHYGVHSHVGKIQMYTDAWNPVNRGEDGNYTPSEVLIQNDTIMDISIGSSLPITVPDGGYILKTNLAGTDFVKANFKIGDKVTIQYTMNALDPLNKEDVNSFKMMVGGHTLLVNEGRISTFTANVQNIQGDAFRSRTGVGYSKSGRYVYLITAQFGLGSAGMSLSEFQQLMVKLGVWKGINLDGGGSTTMVSRPLGEFTPTLTSPPEFGQRRVVNGIGVYTKAPQGTFEGFAIAGKQVLFIEEAANYQLNAYDNFFNPFNKALDNIKWWASNDNGRFEGNTYIPSKAGTTIIQASAAAKKKQLEIEVLGRENISSLRIHSPSLIFKGPGQYKLPVIAVSRTGTQKVVPPKAIQWRLIGFQGTMDGDILTVESLPESGVVQLVAGYDGFSAVLNVPIGVDKLWADFEELSFPITHDVYPAEVSGKAKITNGFADDPNNNAIYLTYNFYEGTGNKASYAKTNAEAGGALIKGEPTKMSLRLLGDNSHNWLRTEVWDANGELRRIDINRDINWYGWKTISVDLTPYNLAYPIRMEHIYVASPWDGHEGRTKGGQVAIDDIVMQYESKKPQMEEAFIKLAIGRNNLTVNGENMQIDQAPILENGTTLVPIRFIIDAMGGEVEWDAANRKVTTLRNLNRIEMWIGNADINVNGNTVTSLLPPRIVSSRTMVPLRLVSEQMGWEVNWEQETKSITLK